MAFFVYIDNGFYSEADSEEEAMDEAYEYFSKLLKDKEVMWLVEEEE